ncbi:MAG: hypothetical protein N2578_00025 [Bdellovibrionaceae bacterium]|nr:hypothetical protein [Pseudobdellovibrionaceae bacterium]
MRLFVLSLGAVKLLVLGLFLAKFWGKSQTYARFDHPFFSRHQHHDALVLTDLPQDTSSVVHQPELIFYLDLRQTQDGHFIVLPPEREGGLLNSQSLGPGFRGPKLHLYDLNTLRKFYPKAPSLEQLMKTLKQRFILNVVDNAADIHTRLVEKIKELGAEDRVLVVSEAEVVLSAIKKVAPLWLFGSSRSEIMRLLSFDSIGIIEASPWKSDVLIVPVKIMGRPAAQPSLIQEARRRKKYVLLGPAKNPEEVAALRGMQPDGIIFSDSSLLRP